MDSDKRRNSTGATDTKYKGLSDSELRSLNMFDQDAIEGSAMKAVPVAKISRSKSSSFMSPFLSNASFFGSPRPPKQVANKDESSALDSTQTQSIFNETLISTASPYQSNRHATVIRHDKESHPSAASEDTIRRNNTTEQESGESPSLLESTLHVIEENSENESKKKEDSKPKVTKEPSDISQNHAEKNNYIINAISPLSNDTLSIPSPSFLYSKTSLESGKDANDNTIKPLSSSVLNIAHNKDGSKVNDSLFRESTTAALDKEDMEEATDKKDNSSSSEESLSHKGRKGAAPARNSWWSRNKHRFFYSILLTFLVLLIAGFTSVVVILARGTRHTVMNYFNSLDEPNREELVQTLAHKLSSPKVLDSLEKGNSNYSYNPDGSFNRNFPEGSNLKQISSFHAISPTYQKDSEIKALMSDDYTSPLFYGVAYAPGKAMEPKCGLTKREVVLDLAKLSRVTSRVRSYGTQCGQADLILESIQDLGLNMTLSLGVWIGADETVNEQQMSEMKRLLKKYPRNLFECIFIGNEVLFREEQTSSSLALLIDDTKKHLNEIGYKDLQVGTSEIGSLIDKKLLQHCDFIGANVHPFFSGTDVWKARKWTYDFIKYQIEPLNKEFKKEIVITEVGWPFQGGKYQSSVASPKAFEYFIKDWSCSAIKENYAWYYFEAFDEPWKTIFYEEDNEWETEWGIFTNSRQEKDHIEMPKC
ncbi:Piso0_001724 [Millerozyma farinosa CBS 7064]|uniref:glucan endo-1,3-beta-D-glucosidase n=1 Tax=Pichia sorbitophila (strain ATCC MYA-4447 / BCRC 22081 / CBS 7064 / NBRC 10061 / NRRL Y-12695) TaxID=559304 RepID=G8YNX5_PICSO|nr:Piso0_001724 [Millerozyma farinosa CBS 7064]